MGRQVRRLLPSQIKRAADRAEAGAKTPTMSVEAVRRAADRAERTQLPPREVPRAPIDDIPF